MITSQPTRTLSLTTFLAVAMLFTASDLEAASPRQQQKIANQVNQLRAAGVQQTAAQRATVRPTATVQPAATVQPTMVKRRSVIAKAAAGEVIDGLPQPPLDGSLVETSQVSHQRYAANCGPVCDCGDCSAEIGCGVEVIGDPGCGIEVGCGLGSIIDTYGPMLGQQCCDGGGCDQCCDNFGILDQGCGIEEMLVEGPACGMDAMGDCSCDACSSCDVDCVPLFLPLLRVQWHRYDFFAGVQGFKGPLNFANTSATDRNGSGSFGFYQGFNEGRSIKAWCGWDVAAQLGVRTTQSNLSGAEFTDETRNQVFVTAGLFRRVDYGLQYGLVLDYLNQDWYFNGDLTQLRGELSWRGKNDCHIWGFQFMTALSDDTSATTVRDQSNNVFNSTVSFESTDQYRFIYRRLLRHNGHWGAFAGWTGEDDALLGADFSLPIRRRLALAGGVTYLLPEQGDSNGGNEEEGWNLSMGFVFRPGGHNGAGRYSRPMFDVADNGTFMVDRQ